MKIQMWPAVSIITTTILFFSSNKLNSRPDSNHRKILIICGLKEKIINIKSLELTVFSKKYHKILIKKEFEWNWSVKNGNRERECSLFCWLKLKGKLGVTYGPRNFQQPTSGKTLRSCLSFVFFYLFIYLLHVFYVFNDFFLNILILHEFVKG